MGSNPFSSPSLQRLRHLEAQESLLRPSAVSSGPPFEPERKRTYGQCRAPGTILTATAHSRPSPNNPIPSWNFNLLLYEQNGVRCNNVSRAKTNSIRDLGPLHDLFAFLWPTCKPGIRARTCSGHLHRSSEVHTE